MAKVKPSETTVVTDKAREAGRTVAAGRVTTEAAVTDGISLAQAGLHRTEAKVKENMDKAMKTAEEFVSFGQGNFEAIMESGRVWAAGVQALSKQAAVTAQAALDDTLSGFKALAAAKTLKEALDIQGGLARANMEKAVAETGRFTDASMKLAEQALAPLAARMTAAVESFGRAV